MLKGIFLLAYFIYILGQPAKYTRRTLC